MITDLETRIVDRFGDTSEEGPVETLKEAGYVRLPDGSWWHRDVTSFDDMDRDDLDCLTHLVETYGHSGLSTVTPSFGTLLISSGLKDGDLPERNRKPLRSLDL